MSTDRESPHSKAAERALLGTVLVAASECLGEVSDLRVDDFMLPEHREVWECVKVLEERGALVNIVTVQDEARARGVVAKFPDREAFALDLARDAAPVEHAIAHAATVRRMATLRRTIALCVETQARAYEMADVDDVLASLRSGIDAIDSSGGADGAIRICDLMDGVVAEMEARSGKRTSEHLAKTGIEAVDKIIGNFRRGHLVTIGGLSGMGKSSFARQVLCFNVMNHLPGIVFSNEMDRGEWTEALISLRSHVPATNLARGRVNLEDWKQKVQPTAKNLCNYPLWVDDRVLTAGKTAGESRRWFAKHVRRSGRDYGLIVVDYLNLVLSDERAENRNREIAKMMAQFKRLAKDLRTTVIQVAQLNRKSAIENREPVMSDFRDCGEIESMSDVIMCPWRESYGKPSTEAPKPFQPDPARILILKQKGGATGGVDVEWHRERMEFTDPIGTFGPQEPPRSYHEKEEDR
jgi:replicative DNA helicase